MPHARKYTAIAALGAGLAVVAAVPASAQWWGGPGYVRWPATDGCCGYGYAAYHPWGYAGYYRPYYYVFYHQPYYAYVDGYHPAHHAYGFYHRPHYGDHHHHRPGYGYERAYHRAYLRGHGPGAYGRY
jgi:hypothetical protein